MKKNIPKIVKKANEIVEAKYRLGEVEQKILILAISKLQADPNSQDQQTQAQVEINTSELEIALNCSKKYVYNQVEKIVNNLHRQILTFRNGSNFEKHNWLIFSKYKNGNLFLSFNPILIPFLTALKSRYTVYMLENVIHLRSKYSIRMYELLKQFEKIGQRKFDIQNFKELLGIQYKNFAEIRRRVIVPAIQEINKNTDIQVEYQEIRQSRKITGIVFYIKSKTPSEKPKIERRIQESNSKRENIRSSSQYMEMASICYTMSKGKCGVLRRNLPGEMMCSFCPGRKEKNNEE